MEKKNKKDRFYFEEFFAVWDLLKIEDYITYSSLIEMEEILQVCAKKHGRKCVSVHLGVCVSRNKVL